MDRGGSDGSRAGSLLLRRERLLVIGSVGTVGLASHASRLSTTSITPYMRTQWPGKVQTKMYSPGFSGR